jgi:hypothetical protein
MIVPTWILAVATSILALSGPVALFAWLGARRSDRERRQREERDQSGERILERARGEFAPKSWATGTAFWGVAAVIVALLAWATREKGD